MTNICSQIYVIFLTIDAQKRQKPRCALIAVLNGLNEIELDIQWQQNQFLITFRRKFLKFTEFSKIEMILVGKIPYPFPQFSAALYEILFMLIVVFLLWKKFMLELN